MPDELPWDQADVTINQWGTLLGSNNFGLATGAANMRRLTASLRFRF